MVKCSKHVIPPAITANLTNQPSHDLELELPSLCEAQVLNGWRLGNHPRPKNKNDRPPLVRLRRNGSAGASIDE